MKGIEGTKTAEHSHELMTIEEAKDMLRAIKGIEDTEERIKAIEDLMFSFVPNADGKKTEGPRANFFEALGQLYLFEKTLHEKGF
jgi:GMP synthase PP-ATPase subunit